MAIAQGIYKVVGYKKETSFGTKAAATGANTLPRTNFALNLIGCFVHTLRLQFLEFFGKWYRDGGKAFRPLKIQTKYVDIKEE